jgi:hypothetical protein
MHLFPHIKLYRNVLNGLLTHLFHGEGYFFEKLTVTQFVKQEPAFVMEPECSLPCSQKPATGPYPEPAESNSPHRCLSP